MIFFEDYDFKPISGASVTLVPLVNQEGLEKLTSHEPTGLREREDTNYHRPY